MAYYLRIVNHNYFRLALMKKLWNKLFKTSQPYNYTIADYSPIKINSLETQVNVTEYDYSQLVETDDMQIDKIYQRN